MPGGRKPNLSRNQIADRLAQSYPGLNQRQALGIMDELFTIIAKSLYDGKEVCIANFGTFQIRHYDSVTLPANGVRKKALEMGPRKAIRFRTGRKLKELINS